MINKTYQIKQEGSQDYAKLTIYIQDDSPEIGIHERPLILVCPGGGYGMTSDREAEVIVFQIGRASCRERVYREV